MTERSERKSPLAQQILAVVAAAIGAVVARVAFGPLLVVGVVALVVGAPLYFLTSGKRRRLVPAAALQMAHGLWGILAAIAIINGLIKIPIPADVLEEALIESALFAGGALLVVLWPSLIPIILLSIYQVVALVINVIAFADNPPPEIRTALVAHIFLRILGVILMFEAYFRKPAPTAAPDAGPSATADLPADETTAPPRDDWDDDLAQRALDGPAPARPRESSPFVLLAIALGGLGLIGGLAAFGLLADNDLPQQRVGAPVPKGPPPKLPLPLGAAQVHNPQPKEPEPAGLLRRIGRAQNGNDGVIGDVWRIGFADAGKVLVTLTREQSLQLWEANSGKELASVKTGGNAGTINCLTISPDGKYVAAWDFFATQVFIRDARTAAIVSACDAHKQSNFSNETAGFTPDSRYLLLVDGSQELGVFPVATGKRITPNQLEKLDGKWVYTTCLPAPDGQNWFIERRTPDSPPSQVERFVVDLASGKQTPLTAFLNRVDRDLALPLRLSPDGSRLLLWTSNMIEVVDWAADRRVALFEVANTTFRALAFTPDGQRLLTVTTDGMMSLYDINDQKPLATRRTGMSAAGDFWSVAVAPDGKTVAVGGNGVTLWNFATVFGVPPLEVPARPAPRDVLDLLWKKPPPPPGLIRAWEAPEKEITQAAFAAGGNILATLNVEQHLHLWEPATGKLLVNLQASRVTTDTNTLVVSPDGNWLVACEGANRSVTVRDARTGKPVAVCKGTGNRSFRGSCAFSAGGKYLFLGIEPIGLQVFSLPDGKRFTPKGASFGQTVRFPNFLPTPDGKHWIVERWVSKANSGTPQLEYSAVEVATGKARPITGFLPKTDMRWPDRLQLAPDGKLLLLVSAERGLQIVDWEKNSPRFGLPPGIPPVSGGRRGREHPPAVWATAAFTPDSQRVIALASDGTLALLNAENPGAIKLVPSGLQTGLYKCWAVAPAPDGKTFAVAAGNTVSIWDFAKTFEVEPLDVPERPSVSDNFPLQQEKK